MFKVSPHYPHITNSPYTNY